MKSVDITVLVEDTVHEPRMRAEHGLSLYIDAGGYRILFDTGASALFLGNAKNLGLHLNDLDALVLSHNHYDHTGGLEFLVDLYSRVPPIYAHPKTFSQSYRKSKGGKGSTAERVTGRPIGFPYPLGLTGLQTRGIELTMNREPMEIHRDIWLGGEVLRNCPFEDVGKSFFIDAELSQVDDVVDDQALILKTDAGLIVITGCCHSGIVNTMEAVASLFPGSPVRAVVGGFHLFEADAGRIKRSVEYLKGLHPQLIVAGHCSGFDALCTLRRTFGKRFHRLSVGSRFSLPGP
ncbi:MAG: MBL fold metallo-hydrolase [Spirochaetaceae bacterium]|nr:MAG: MBL fold metallo-hydrolase [Spirochaetaceae bacterium]